MEALRLSRPVVRGVNRAACPDMVERGSYDPGLQRAGVVVRVVGVFRCTSAPRFHSGIVRLVESAVKPSRRHTKARRS